MAEKSIDIAVTTIKSGASITTSSGDLTNSVRLVWDDTVEAGSLITAIERVKELAQEYMQDK